ncbi:MAG: glycosyltransferase [Gammaproteobacteria bacterium]|nr:glycosyltransferase [Gammaproteobacteria bacterium]MCW5584044.1 glycosyltransferase [Gammaproteobacteria bacterium]
MRVLFLYPRTLDADRSVGGVAEFLCSLVPVLKQLGVDPIIYAGDKTVNKLTVPAQVLTDAKVYNGPFIKPSLFISKSKLAPVLKLCHMADIEVIHAQGTYTAGFMAWQIHKRTGIPYVVTSHSDILTTNSKRINRSNVRRRCRHVLKHAAAVTHLTLMMEEISHQLWDTRQKSTVIGNGIDCLSWKPYAQLPERNYILGIGRLERGKGFDVLLDMYARLVQRDITSSLIIAGKGSEEQNLFAQTRRLGLRLVTDFKDFSHIPEKSVMFTGYVRDEVKKRLIAQSQCVLFATQPDLWEEAFGIVQLEAMVAGKPIIASDTNATRFLQQTGLQVDIVKPNDVQAWADQTEVLLRDPLLRMKLGEVNLKAAAQFDWQPIAKQYYDVFVQAEHFRHVHGGSHRIQKNKS